MTIEEAIEKVPVDLVKARLDAIMNAPPGLMAEFGVSTGRYLREMAKIAWPRKFYGFDSFEGLPEDWGMRDKKGAFKCDPPTDLPDNVELVIGLFQDRLPAFLDWHKTKFAFIHMDADIYSSTKYVLDTVRPWLDGTFIMFDQITRDDYCVEHEGRAMQEFVNETGVRWECVGRQKRDGAIFKVWG